MSILKARIARRTFRRPEIMVAIDREPLNEGCEVCIQLGEEMGQPMRWLEFTPAEARQLASRLNEVASQAEQEDLDQAS